MNTKYVIPFDKPPIPDTALKYISDVMDSRKLSGNGQYTKRCQQWFSDRFGAVNNLLTTSASSALDMIAHLITLQSGDEVIMPSFTFASTANAFAGVGAKIIFIDIRPDTMNISEMLIEQALTPKTKAIVAVHYAGVACEMDIITSIANKYNLIVIEDAAQAVMSKYKNNYCGTLGDFACYSFHSTKNYSMGEGGAINIKDKGTFKQAEIMWEKGTDRSKFMRGEIDKYSWVGWGSSYLPSEINAAYLWSQLEMADDINDDRLISWNKYYELLKPLADDELIRLPYVPAHCAHNAHIFYIRTQTHEMQASLLRRLKERNVGAVFHYVPLHLSLAGQKFGEFCGEDKYTTVESGKLIRLPLYYGLAENDLLRVVDAIFEFFGRRAS